MLKEIYGKLYINDNMLFKDKLPQDLYTAFQIISRSGYKFFTKLDISMQYYTFLLDEASRNLCTFATPFGLYRYCRLPMGVSESPDIATEKMHLVLDGIEDIEFYMDDIGVFSNGWDAHLSLLSLVLTRLQDLGFTINPLKCEWAVQETNFLGHWLTLEGVKPWHKKIEAIYISNHLLT